MEEKKNLLYTSVFDCVNSLAKHLGQLLDRGQQEKFAFVLADLTKRAGTSLWFCRELLDLEFVRKVNGEEATILRVSFSFTVVSFFKKKKLCSGE